MRATKSPSKVTVAVILLMASFSELATSDDDDSFVYAGCSPQKYLSGTEYEANVNSLLASILTSSSSTRSPFTNLTSGPIHGLFQSRLDLPTTNDCHACVSTNLYQLSVLCPGSVSAVLRLQGCYVRYGNSDFLGVEDKTVVVNTCGPQQLQFDSGELARRDSMLGYLASEGELLRKAGTGDGGVQGVAECVGDLSPDQCRDCLGQAVSLLQNDCLYASSGGVYLASCYARYYTASHAPSRLAGATNDDGDWRKTLAIILLIIAVVVLLLLYAAYLGKHCKDGNHK